LIILDLYAETIGKKKTWKYRIRVSAGDKYALDSLNNPHNPGLAVTRQGEAVMLEIFIDPECQTKLIVVQTYFRSNINFEICVGDWIGRADRHIKTVRLAHRNHQAPLGEA
jgi:hypothetical protein